MPSRMAQILEAEALRKLAFSTVKSYLPTKSIRTSFDALLSIEMFWIH